MPENLYAPEHSEKALSGGSQRGRLSVSLSAVRENFHAHEDAKKARFELPLAAVVFPDPDSMIQKVGANVFHCLVCFKVFGHLRNAKRHVKELHTTVEYARYVCKLCPDHRVYKRERHWKAHMKVDHNKYP